MTAYVLVHGSWFGAISWAKVTPYLTREGHRVTAPSLPSFDGDPTPVGEVTFEDAVDVVERAVRGAGEPIILVGHSRGGMIITAVAERVPELIRKSVYLAAYLPQSGQSLFDIAGEDVDSLAVKVLQPDASGLFTTLGTDREAIRASLMGDVSDADLDWAISLMGPEPMSMGTTPVHTTPDRFGAVDKAYIHTREDRGLTYPIQRRIAELADVTEVYELDGSHSPFFAQPQRLAEVLTTIGE